MNIRGTRPPLPIVHFDPDVIRDHEIAAPGKRSSVGIIKILDARKRWLTIPRRCPEVVRLIPAVDANRRAGHEHDGICDENRQSMSAAFPCASAFGDHPRSSLK